MDISKKKFFYRILVAAAVIISCLTFTPLVIPYGKFEPSFLSLPYTLWTGLLVSVLLVLITFLATRIHPGKEENKT